MVHGKAFAIKQLFATADKHQGGKKHGYEPQYHHREDGRTKKQSGRPPQYLKYFLLHKRCYNTHLMRIPQTIHLIKLGIAWVIFPTLTPKGTKEKISSPTILLANAASLSCLWADYAFGTRLTSTFRC